MHYYWLLRVKKGEGGEKFSSIPVTNSALGEHKNGGK